MRIAFVGYVVDEASLQGGAYSLADNKMQQNFLGALSLIDKSLLALSSSNSSPGKLIKKKDTSLINNVLVKYMPQVTVPVLKQIGLFLSLYLHLALWAFKHRKENKILIYYNTFLSYGLLAVFLKLIFNVKVVPIAITRPYVYKIHPNLLDRAQSSLSKKCHKKIDGVIAITKPLAKLINKNVPNCVVCGGVSVVSLDKEMIVKKNNGSEPAFSVVYTGTLYERYHIREILEAIIMLPKKDFELHIYGKGDLVDVVQLFASKQENIFYHGVVGKQDLKNAQANADVLLSILDTNDNLAKYSFPSKIFEYMSTGQMIIASNLSTYPEGMAKHLLIIKDFNKNSIAAEIKGASMVSDAKRTKASKDMIEYLNNSHTWVRISDRLRLFLDGLGTSR